MMSRSLRVLAVFSLRSLLGALLIAALVVAPMPGRAQSAPLRIGLVTDIGSVSDRSFNQSAWEGAKTAADLLGGEADYIETTDSADYANNIRIFIDQGYNVIITVGFALGDATLTAAAQYPDVHFVAVDVDTDQLMNAANLSLKNVTGLIFPENQSGFLAGFLAARMTQTGVIAQVLPAEIPPVARFKEGFESGAQWASQGKVKILSTYHPGGLAVAFTDPAWGALTAGQAIDQGADVIFSGGGTTGNGGLQEVARRTTPEEALYCIGVDTDQWYSVPEAQPCLITSAVKQISDGVVAIIQALREGNLPSGNFVGQVGLAPMHDFEEIVPQAVKDEIEQVRADLQSGKLKPDGSK